MNADEGPGHWWIARQEQRFSFLQKAGESITNRIRSQIRPVIADPNDHRRWLILT